MAKKTNTPEGEEALALTTTAPEPNLGVGDYNWDEHNGPTGMEGVTAEELSIPFISICQKASPEMDPDHADHATKAIAGIQVGDLFNSASREIVYARNNGRPLVVVPCFRVRLWQEWVPRSKGGGFVKTHASQEGLLGRTKEIDGDEGPRRIVLVSGEGVGNEIVETVSWACLAWLQGSWQTVLINMQKSNLTPARQWTTRAMSIRKTDKQGKVYCPALYSHSYHLSTQSKKGKKGSYYVFQVALAGEVKAGAIVQQAQGVTNFFQADLQKLLAPAAKAAATETAEHGVDEEGNPY